MKPQRISIADDFHKAPGGRYNRDGPFSGQAFRDQLLIPALKDGNAVEINMDGTIGLGGAFLEEAFGGLVRAGFDPADLRKRLTIISYIDAYRDRIWRYIDTANAQKLHQLHASS